MEVPIYINTPPYTFETFSNTAVQPNFTFVVDGKKYKCHSLAICAASKVISSEYLGRPNPIKEYKFTDLKDPNHYFEQFIMMLNGQECDITFSNSLFLNYVASKLEIAPLVAATKQIAFTKPTQQNALNYISNYAEHNIKCPEFLKFVHQNWTFFEKDSKLSLLNLSALQYMFESNDFKPKNQEWFIAFVENLVQKRGCEFTKLYYYCNFPNISNRQMNKIIEEVAIDQISTEFLESIESRFIEKVDPNSETEGNYQNNSNLDLYPKRESQLQKQKAETPKIMSNSNNNNFTNNNYNNNNNNNNNNFNTYNDHNNTNNNLNKNSNLPTRNQSYSNTSYRSKQSEQKNNDSDFYSRPPQFFTYSSNKDRFKGVFNYIKKEQPTRFQNFVKIICGGDGMNVVYHLFDYDDIWKFHWNTYSKTEQSKLKNAYLIVHFPFHHLTLSHYTFASTSIVRDKDLEGLQPKSWKIDGSEDMNKWTNLTTVTNSSEMRDREAIATFPTKVKIPFSYFKITLIENGAKPTKPFYNQLKLNALEFYGTFTTNP